MLPCEFDGLLLFVPQHCPINYGGTMSVYSYAFGPCHRGGSYPLWFDCDAMVAGGEGSDGMRILNSCCQRPGSNTSSTACSGIGAHVVDSFALWPSAGQHCLCRRIVAMDGTGYCPTWCFCGSNGGCHCWQRAASSHGGQYVGPLVVVRRLCIRFGGRDAAAEDRPSIAGSVQANGGFSMVYLFDGPFPRAGGALADGLADPLGGFCALAAAKAPTTSSWALCLRFENGPDPESRWPHKTRHFRMPISRMASAPWPQLNSGSYGRCSAFFAFRLQAKPMEKNGPIFLKFLVSSWATKLQPNIQLCSFSRISTCDSWLSPISVCGQVGNVAYWLRHPVLPSRSFWRSCCHASCTGDGRYDGLLRWCSGGTCSRTAAKQHVRGTTSVAGSAHVDLLHLATGCDLCLGGQSGLQF